MNKISKAYLRVYEYLSEKLEDYAKLRRSLETGCAREALWPNFPLTYDETDRYIDINRKFISVYKEALNDTNPK